MTRPKQKAKTQVYEVPTLFRPRDLVGMGVPKSRLHAWIREGTAEQLGRGLYRRTDAEASELETIAMISKRTPRAVICLLTALHIHGIGTQAPASIWIAIDRKARAPQLSSAQLRVVRFAPNLLRYGVERREVLGVPVHITSPARTIVDCFRYRSKVGLDVALEALADGLRSRHVSVSQLVRVAKVTRTAEVMRPYLESLTL